MYLQLSQAPGGGALSTQRCSPPKFIHPLPPLFSHRRPKFLSAARFQGSRKPLLVVAEATGGGVGPGATKSKPVAPLTGEEESIAIVGEENVPLEGVIQFEKPNSYSRLQKWGHVALLAGGDVLAILLFSAIGRFSHGFSVFDIETLRTADPFIAGWVLSSYFLGGYGDDGRGINGRTSAIVAAVKSWSLGIPLGIFIRATSLGHIPPTGFIVVTMGSTAFLLIGWRALLSSIFPGEDIKKNDDYKRGNPFELFELLTSLVRRW